MALTQKEKDSRRTTTFTRIGIAFLQAIKILAMERGTTARDQIERCALGMDPKASRVLRERFKVKK